MVDKVKISIVLPVYNGEKTIKSTLESLLNQTFQDFEVIACVDGTNDSSKQILESFYLKFKRLIIIENDTNIGLGPTMNRLVSNAKGDYIAVAEQDDYYYENRLKLQVEILDNNKEIGLVSGIAEFWNGKKVTSLFPGLLVGKNQYPKGKGMFLLNYRNQIKVVNSCMMFRKSIHIKKGLYFTKHHPNISVDWTYILRFSLISEIYGIPEVLVRLDRRPERDSITTKKENQFKASRELIKGFAYEYPDIITKQDYKFALNTQKIMEISQFYGWRFYLKCLWIIIINPNEKRYRNIMLNRFNKRKK